MHILASPNLLLSLSLIIYAPILILTISCNKTQMRINSPQTGGVLISTDLVYYRYLIGRSLEDTKSIKSKNDQC